MSCNQPDLKFLSAFSFSPPLSDALVVRPPVAALFVPSVAPPVITPSVAAPVASLSSALISIESLTAEVKQKATLESAPSSQKAVRFPNRPGYGQLGRKIQVRANHFQLRVADKDLHHYDVSISPEITSKKVCREIINQLVKMYKEMNFRFFFLRTSTSSVIYMRINRVKLD
ncbi:protein argonaute 5-like [Vicia villosa]|uniref:protein argonaute 5-like n=1 Tax=Vicia villosa TaxID=3911 RepID=UPI00273AE55B|nr:protein argonaute 5-like [Vicia villosa]